MKSLYTEFRYLSAPEGYMELLDDEDGAQVTADRYLVLDMIGFHSPEGVFLRGKIYEVRKTLIKKGTLRIVEHRVDVASLKPYSCTVSSDIPRTLCNLHYVALSLSRDISQGVVTPQSSGLLWVLASSLLFSQDDNLEVLRKWFPLTFEMPQGAAYVNESTLQRD